MSFGEPGPPRERKGTESETHFPACGTRRSICVNTTAFRLVVDAAYGQLDGSFRIAGSAIMLPTKQIEWLTLVRRS